MKRIVRLFEALFLRSKRVPFFALSGSLEQLTAIFFLKVLCEDIAIFLLENKALTYMVKALG
jgi:hypothetical protein